MRAALAVLYWTFCLVGAAMAAMAVVAFGATPSWWLPALAAVIYAGCAALVGSAVAVE